MKISVAAVSVALSLASVTASADVTKDQCVDANAKAQPLRRDGKLVAARVQLLICVDSHCPGIVRDDCAQRLDELDRAQPTIVFEAKDAGGSDVSAVQVSVDGRALADKLDGTALAVDPGDHVFVFEAGGAPPVTRRFVLREGEKLRRERVVVGAALSSPAPVSVAPPSLAQTDVPLQSPPPLLPEAAGGSGRKKLGLVVGSVGVAGVIVGSAFGVLTIVSWNKSQGECRTPATPTNCPDYADAVSNHDAAVRSGTISTIGFIAGGALLAGGVALWLSGPSDEERSSRGVASIRVAPSVDTRSMGVALKGEF